MGFLSRWRMQGAIREQELALASKSLDIESRMLESLSLTTSCIDPTDAIRDPRTGELWDPLGAWGAGSRALGTPGALKDMRSQMRILADTNPFAINGHENVTISCKLCRKRPLREASAPTYGR